MKTDFVSYLNSESVMILKGQSKRTALEDIIAFAAQKTGVERQQISDMVWKREKMMTTGVGDGLALPHVRISGIYDPVVVVAVCENPVKDYESLDKKPVRLIVFLMAQDGDQEAYLKLLGSISKRMKCNDTVEKIIGLIKKPSEIYKLLKKKV